LNQGRPNLIQSILSHPLVSRIRRNHGLEHATLHVLAQRHPRRSLAGHSDAGGFWLIGDVSTEEVQSAVGEALRRLKAGEQNLAVHPNCGTNLVTAGLLAGTAAFMAMFGAGRRFRDKLERLPLAASMATFALILAQPMGYLLQERFTTSGQPELLEVAAIFPARRGWMHAHRVLTRG